MIVRTLCLAGACLWLATGVALAQDRKPAEAPSGWSFIGCVALPTETAATAEPQQTVAPPRTDPAPQSTAAAMLSPRDDVNTPSTD